ncbi:MAG: alcohol dehydrogenase catalytic domain-containing protein [Candidatus Aminicenantaceae bacterium]
MRAAVYYNNRDVRLEKRARPEIGPGEILMRTEASGLCGSDVLEWYRIKKAPLVLGHEVAGMVEEVGEGVKAFLPGDRIVAAHHVPCNTCHYCLMGHHTACDTLRATNFDPGGFAEFIRLPAINVDRGTFKIPDSLSFEAATFHEPLGCIIRSHRILNIESGQCLAVLGSGISGLLYIHLARHAGAGRILAVDPVPFRRDAALRFGADCAVAPDDEVVENLRGLNSGRLADQVIVCTGAEQAQYDALNLVERGGTVMFFAIPAGEVRVPVSINSLLFRNDITLTTSYGAAPRDSWEALRLLQSPALNVAGMITHRLPLDQTGDGFRLVAEAGESLKVIIKPQE